MKLSSFQRSGDGHGLRPFPSHPSSFYQNVRFLCEERQILCAFLVSSGHLHGRFNTVGISSFCIRWRYPLAAFGLAPGGSRLPSNCFSGGSGGYLSDH